MVGAAAAVQNIVPIPVADLVVLFGAFIVATHPLGWLAVFLAAWIGNAGVALLIYALARYYRSGRAEPRFVHWLLAKRDTDPHAADAPRSWDLFPVFVGCFLPVRPLLPILAGLGGIPFWRLLLPVGGAAAAWYTGIVLVGSTSGRNFQAVSRAFAQYNREFTLATVALLAAAAVFWLIRRRRRSS